MSTATKTATKSVIGTAAKAVAAAVVSRRPFMGLGFDLNRLAVKRLVGGRASELHRSGQESSRPGSRAE